MARTERRQAAPPALGLAAGVADARVQLGLWTLAAVLLATQAYLIERLVWHEPSNWPRHVLYWLPLWWFWPAVAPLVLKLGRRFPLRRRWPLDVPLHFLAALALTTAHTALDVVWFSVVQPFELPERNFTAFFLRRIWTQELYLDLLIYGALVAFTRAVSGHLLYREQAVRASRLTARLAEARLQALRAQLRPHFLFNTLNAISTLALQRDRQALAMLHRLNEFFHLTFDDPGRQEIPLRQELARAAKYLEIEKIRFADRLRLVQEIDPASLDALVPSLVLQPILENAVRHGIAAKKHGGTLRLASEVRGDRLRLRVSDDGVGCTSGATPRIGLSNTQERLQQLYGEAGQLTLASPPEGGFAVTLEFPLRGKGLTAWSAS